MHRLRPRNRRVPLRLEAHLRNHRRRAVLQQRGAVFPVPMARPTACTQVLMQRPSASIRQHGLKAWRAMEGGFDTAFGSALNPLRQLGGLGFYLFWLIAVSGGYLYIFYDTRSMARTRRSRRSRRPVGRRRDAQPASLRVGRVRGGAGRAPAARTDARAVRGFRWYSWLSGIPTLWLAVSAGVIGASGSSGTRWRCSWRPPPPSGSVRCPASGRRWCAISLPRAPCPTGCSRWWCSCTSGCRWCCCC